MPCYRPLQAWRGRSGPSGRSSIHFKKRDSLGIEVTLPCGQCVGCRLERSRQWAVRMMHESSLHTDNSFITLTYDAEHVPASGSLDVAHFQDFMKRLRWHYRDRKIRFFHCGEYGENLGRPHYHAMLFGLDFADKSHYSGDGAARLFTSETLQDLWPFGFSTVGACTFESAAYIARYVVKKVTGDAAADHYQVMHPITGELTSVAPEYVTMSRRPGIASDWFRKFGNEVFPSDEVIARGHPAKPPRFYEKLFEAAHGDFESVRRKRMRNARERAADNTPERLAVRELCAKARLKVFSRKVETGDI